VSGANIPAHVKEAILHAHLYNEEQELLSEIPEWRDDPEKAKQEMMALRKFAVDHGGDDSEQAFGPILDHAIVLKVRGHYLAHKEAEDERAAAQAESERDAAKEAAVEKKRAADAEAVGRNRHRLGVAGF
jgi:hypothetical protein